MAKRTEKTTGASDLVQCGECTRWCYLDETAFTSLADAEEASFVCKLCEKVKAAAQRMESCIEELKGELKVERVKRIELQAQLGEARERGEATASLVEQMEADLRKEQERRAELEERVKVLMALDPGSERGEAKGEGSTDSQAGKEVGAGDSMEEASRSYSDVARQSGGAGSTGSGLGAASREHTADGELAGANRSATISSWKRTIGAVEEGVFTTVKADRRVRVEAQSGKCMMDALAKAQVVVGDSMNGEYLVIIHAGLNDVLKGKNHSLQRQLEGGGYGPAAGYSVMEVNQDVYGPGSRPLHKMAFITVALRAGGALRPTVQTRTISKGHKYSRRVESVGEEIDVSTRAKLIQA
ncbi:hypothetical protein HPB52_014074 [Rhipicephalus sanguineus]|uniref:Uncharacterized protein n=1 Tax=Rhipicephalus sanguineus TaxID=34632 RepID=A0A9D4Q6R6_RHISA|nr:hypothetical protein HPB52_014074 [Rhipicephalus sanguineus]